MERALDSASEEEKKEDEKKKEENSESVPVMMADAAGSLPDACCLAEVASGVSSPECFVATMVFQTAQHPDLDALRSFRDLVLAKSKSGLLFIRLYYRWGRYVALFIRHKPILKCMIRDVLVRPMARFARWKLR